MNKGHTVMFRELRTVDRVALSNEVIFSELDGEAVALNVRRGACYGLSKVGRRILEMLDHPIAAGALIDTLVEEFEVDALVCARETLDLLEQLRAEGMIVVEWQAQGL